MSDNVQMGEEHMHLMDRDERMIQHAGGVTDDNLGRRTNAVSGEAIKARQLQGSVVTAEIFDNERFAIQHQGEIQLSNAEQFMTEEKVIRLTGAKDKIEWHRINQPEVQPDGSVRYVNDITASQADFIVDEQDFHQSVRQAMFETMVDLVGKIASVNAEAGLRILRMALDFSDLPNKEEMSAEVKNMLGIVDDKDIENMTPQQKEALQQQVAAKREAAELQRRAAIAEVAEKEAKTRKLDADGQKVLAEAEKARAEATAMANGEGGELVAAKIEFERKLAEAERQAAEAVDQAREQLEKLSQQLRDRNHEIDTKAKTEKEIAQINAQAKVDEAKILGQYQSAIDGLKSDIADALSELKKVASRQEQLERSTDKDRTERGAREKAEKETAAAKEKDKKPEQQGPLVVFEKGAFEGLVKGGGGKTVTAKIGGKTVKMRIEPDDAGTK
jgi:hypothetical protein